MPDLLTHLRTRRTIPAANLTGPGPSQAQLEEILTIAARVPDHGKLAPWRFVIYPTASNEHIGPFLKNRWQSIEREAPDDRLALEETRFARAGVIVGVISSPVAHPKIPEWEQFLSAGAVCLNMIHAAAAHGFIGQWLTEWYAEDDLAARYLGCRPGERFAGFIHIGTPVVPPTERPRPEVSRITSHWHPPATGIPIHPSTRGEPTPADRR